MNKKKSTFILFILSYIFFAILFGTIYFFRISKSEEQFVYTTEKLIYNAFLNINNVMQDVERVIRGNSSFFENYNESISVNNGDKMQESSDQILQVCAD